MMDYEARFDHQRLLTLEERQTLRLCRKEVEAMLPQVSGILEALNRGADSKLTIQFSCTILAERLNCLHSKLALLADKRNEFRSQGRVGALQEDSRKTKQAIHHLGRYLHALVDAGFSASTKDADFTSSSKKALEPKVLVLTPEDRVERPPGTRYPQSSPSHSERYLVSNDSVVENIFR